MAPSMGSKYWIGEITEAKGSRKGRERERERKKEFEINDWRAN